MPATSILAEEGRERFSSAALMLLVATWAFFVHLIGGFAAVGLILLGGIFGTAAQRKRSLKLIGAASLLLAWLWRTFQSAVQREIDRLGDLPVDFTIFDAYGRIGLGIWAAGIIVMALLPDEATSEISVPAPPLATLLRRRFA